MSGPLSLRQASALVFDRLGLENSKSINEAWRKHLLPSLRRGLVAARGRLVEHYPDGGENRHGPTCKVWRRYEVGEIPIDWWIDSAPQFVDVFSVSLVRDGNQGLVEQMDFVTIDSEDIERLWPLTIEAIHEKDFSEACVFIGKMDKATKKSEAQTALKAHLGPRYTDRIFRDAWRSRPEEMKSPGGRPRKNPAQNPARKPAAKAFDA